MLIYSAYCHTIAFRRNNYCQLFLIYTMYLHYDVTPLLCERIVRYVYLFNRNESIACRYYTYMHICIMFILILLCMRCFEFKPLHNRRALVQVQPNPLDFSMCLDRVTRSYETVYVLFTINLLSNLFSIYFVDIVRFL